MTRPFGPTMDTLTESPASKDSLPSFVTRSNPKLSRQSSRVELRLSNASKRTLQRINDNARITKGKKSDNVSSSSSTLELSNRSLTSTKDQRKSSDRSQLSARDSRESKPGHRESAQNSANTISETPDRPSRSTVRKVQHPDNYGHTEPSKERNITDTPNREITRMPLASHKTVKKKINENPEVLKKTPKSVEIENRLEKRKQGMVPKKQLNVRYQNNNRKTEISAKPDTKMMDSTTEVRTKTTINKISRTNTAKKIQTTSSRQKLHLVPKPPVTKDDNGTITKFKKSAPVKGAREEKPKLQDGAKKSFKTTASDRITKPTSISSTSKQSNRPLPKTVAGAERLLQAQRKKAGSKTNITNVEPITDSNPTIPKTVAEAERLLCIWRKKEESDAHITTDDSVADASAADGQEFCSTKENQDSALDDSQIERYFKLLDEFNENEEKIEENQREVALQKKEMDDIYSNIRNEIEDLAEYTGEVVRARKINKNFKDESARIRVHHNTNIIAVNMYEAANIDLQNQIAGIHEEINETKAINHLKPEDLKAKIKEVWKLFDNQRQTNASLEEEIEQLKNDLNTYKCGGNSLAKLSDEAIKMINENPQNDTKPNKEALSGKGTSLDKGMRASESKSADVVSLTTQGEPRETKFEHRPESRFQKIINSARALLPGRKKKQNIPKEVPEMQTHIPNTEKLLQKRHKTEAENNSHCLKPTWCGSEESKPTKYLTPEGRPMSDDQKKTEIIPFSKKPILHRRPQQNTDLTTSSGISPCTYIPHPPVSSPPNTIHVRSLRAINHISKYIYKP